MLRIVKTLPHLSPKCNHVSVICPRISRFDSQTAARSYANQSAKDLLKKRGKPLAGQYGVLSTQLSLIQSHCVSPDLG